MGHAGVGMGGKVIPVSRQLMAVAVAAVGVGVMMMTGLIN